MNPAQFMGGQAARAAFGLKNGVNWVTSRPRAVGSALTTPGWWKAQGQGAAHTMFGAPHEFMSQLSEGQLHKPGGLLRETLRPRGALDALGRYGLPLLGAYGALHAPASQRGSAVGSVLGSAVGGMLGSPLGLVGQIGGSALLGNLGSTVGSLFDSAPPPQSPLAVADDQAESYYPSTRATQFGV